MKPFRSLRLRITLLCALLLTLCFFRHVYKTMIAQIPEGRA